MQYDWRPNGTGEKWNMRLVVMPGDGIGPEVTAATVRVLEKLDRRLDLGIALETHEVGFATLGKDGTTLPATALKAAHEADGVILGPVSTLEYPAPEKGGINVSAALRRELDLYANLRPARSRRGIPHYGRTAMDLVIARENTEGFYAVRTMYLGYGEFMPTPDLAFAIRKVSAAASRRIARAGFGLAMRRRKKVTGVHKANVLMMSEALFLSEVRKVAAEFPAVAYDEQLVDSMTAMLVRDAARFDVVVTTNLFGDILSDLSSELSGSLGLGASVNAGDTHCMAQAQHGSAPDIAGQDKANPVSLILSAAMLLDWLADRHRAEKFSRAAAAIDRAVDTVLEHPETRTRDLGGKLGTSSFTASLVDALEPELAAAG
ncbi:MAG TPA: isocitrate/isopropylmalate family dehydrogenase [Acetobacteraceae bacterium]|nr:isocitrate/isopropylmalate family dehydrogenase [Acetobacteraceae bacterium]